MWKLVFWLQFLGVCVNILIQDGINNPLQKVHFGASWIQIIAVKAYWINFIVVLCGVAISVIFNQFGKTSSP